MEPALDRAVVEQVGIVDRGTPLRVEAPDRLHDVVPAEDCASAQELVGQLSLAAERTVQNLEREPLAHERQAHTEGVVVALGDDDVGDGPVHDLHLCVVRARELRHGPTPKRHSIEERLPTIGP